MEERADFGLPDMEDLRQGADVIPIPGLKCPRIVYTDLDTSLCKAFEETLLMCVEHSSRTLWPSIGRHLPHQPHDP